MSFLKPLGSVAGWLGAAVCLLTGVGRIIGIYWILGMESGTVFQSGIALMVFACLVKLQDASG